MKINDLYEASNEGYLFRALKLDKDTPVPSTLTIYPDDKKYRQPRTSSPFIHKLVNALAYEKFGVYVRNLPFFYAKYEHSVYYGSVYLAKVDSSMTFYYADGVFDFTTAYHAIRYNDLSHIKFIDAVYAANNIIPDETFSTYFRDAVKDISTEIQFDILDIKTMDDVNRIYTIVGEQVFNAMVEHGYEHPEHRERIITMIIDGFKLYLKKFYDYVDLLKSTNNVFSIPEDVEIMVDADSINMELRSK